MAKPKTEVIINDSYKIVRYDSLNWQVYKWREIGKAVDKDKQSREGESDWMPTGRFYGSLVPALRWIAEECIADSGEKYDLQ